MQQQNSCIQDIRIKSKKVEYCGKLAKKSKKNVKWVIEHKSLQSIRQSTINCTVSFKSGKKKVQFNSQKVYDVTGPHHCLTSVVNIEKMFFAKITIDKDKEDLSFEPCDYQSVQNPFIKFKNVFCEELPAIYEEIFNKS